MSTRKYVVLVFVLFWNSAFSADAITANVTFAGIYGDGEVFVNLDQTIPEPGCTINRFDIKPDHPNAKIFLSIAMTALSSGKAVVVRTSGCYRMFPTLDTSTDTFFYLK